MPTNPAAMHCLVLSDAEFTALIAAPERIARMRLGQMIVITGNDPAILQKKRAGDSPTVFAVLTAPNDCEVSVVTEAPGAADTRRITVEIRDQFGEAVNNAFVLLAVRSNQPLISAAIGPTGKLRGGAFTGNGGLIVLATFPTNVASVDIVGTAAAEGDVDVLVQSPGPGQAEADTFVF